MKNLTKPLDFMKNPANLITFCRFPLSAALLFLPAMSVPFGIVYLLCGISDVADGLIARKTHTESETGAKLDSTADIIFITVSAVKILPLIHLDLWLWVWIALIAAVKTGAVIKRFLRCREIAIPHSFLNKLTGILLFILPLTASFASFRYFVVFVCAVATASAVQDFFITEGN